MSQLCAKQKHKSFNGCVKQYIEMKKKYPDKEFTMYYCAQCNSYHITSKKSKQFIKTVN